MESRFLWILPEKYNFSPDALNAVGVQRAAQLVAGGARFEAAVFEHMQLYEFVRAKSSVDLRDQAAAVRLPRTLYEQGAQLTRARRELTMQLMREPTLSELAECLGWDEARTLDTLLSLESGRGVSLDEEAGEGEIPLHEMLGAEDQHITSAADYASVKTLLDALPPRDARLLTLRYLENRSQRDTARALDMTQMQVHRAEKRLLALLRERLESK